MVTCLDDNGPHCFRPRPPALSSETESAILDLCNSPQVSRAPKLKTQYRSKVDGRSGREVPEEDGKRTVWSGLGPLAR